MHGIILLLLAFSQSFSQNKTNIAVLDLAADGIKPAEARTLTNKFRGELLKTGKYIVVERGEMENVLKEQGFQQSGCTSQECVVQAGQLLGVTHMIAGSVGKIENTYVISVRLINVANGRIEKNVEEQVAGSLINVLNVGIKKVAKEMAGGHRLGRVCKRGGSSKKKITKKQKA